MNNAQSVAEYAIYIAFFFYYLFFFSPYATRFILPTIIFPSSTSPERRHRPRLRWFFLFEHFFPRTGPYRTRGDYRIHI